MIKSDNKDLDLVSEEVFAEEKDTHGEKKSFRETANTLSQSSSGLKIRQHASQEPEESYPNTDQSPVKSPSLEIVAEGKNTTLVQQYPSGSVSTDQTAPIQPQSSEDIHA